MTAEKAAKDPAGFAKGLAQGFAGIPVLETMQVKTAWRGDRVIIEVREK